MHREFTHFRIAITTITSTMSHFISVSNVIYFCVSICSFHFSTSISLFQLHRVIHECAKKVAIRSMNELFQSGMEVDCVVRRPNVSRFFRVSFISLTRESFGFQVWIFDFRFLISALNALIENCVVHNIRCTACASRIPYFAFQYCN